MTQGTAALPKKRGRGRPAKSAEEAKRHSIGITTTRDLRDKIKAAAERSGSSITREIELRLEMSFAVEQRALSRETGALINAITAVVGLIENQTGHAWHEDQKTFFAVRDAITLILRANSPEEILPTHSDLKDLRTLYEEKIAARLQFEQEHPKLASLDTFTVDDIESEDMLNEAHRLIDEETEAFRAFARADRTYIERAPAKLSAEMAAMGISWSAAAKLAPLFRIKPRPPSQKKG